MPGIRFTRPFLLVPTILLLLGVHLAFAGLPVKTSSSQKGGNSKKQVQRKEKGFWCGSPLVVWTVDVDSQFIPDEQTSDVILGQAVRRVYPSYPAQAIVKRVEGDVVVEVIVSKTGDISSIKSVSGPSALTEASTYSAKKWRFTPTTMRGEPIDVLARISFRYDLGKNK